MRYYSKGSINIEKVEDGGYIVTVIGGKCDQQDGKEKVYVFGSAASLCDFIEKLEKSEEP